MNPAGIWNIRIKTPIGEQVGTVTVVPDGAGRFTGSVGGDLGSMDIAGTVEGNRLNWKMKIAKPMPLDLDCHADVEGDALTGGLKAGVFGSFGLTGTRAG